MPHELGGDSKSIGFLGYDADKNMYTSSEFTSQGRREFAQDSLNGDTWTWTSSEKYEGQEIYERTSNQLDGHDGSKGNKK